ncbi:hypothetical protein BDZ97DRAFT_1772696 [Flammula alnicola]|nr:hypothetical protein BDZ97DRAFT_1772696 [Flammula alnicola]
MSVYSKQCVYPPLDATVNIPDTVEFHWKHNPDLAAYTFHEDGRSADELTYISYLEYGRACHRIASALGPKIGSTTGRPVVALMANSDSLLYHATTVGLMKAGLIPFPISQRNTPAMVVHLLQKTDCHHLVTTQATLKELLAGVQTELDEHHPGYELLIEEVPPLKDIFPKLGAEREDDPFTPYAINHKLQPTDIAMYLHSSGSTGFPKAIPQSHRTLVSWAAFPGSLMFRDHTPRLRIAAMHLPPFHALGMFTLTILPLYSCTTIALYPPAALRPDLLPTMPTPDNILDHLSRTQSNAITTIPTLLQVWAQDENSVNLLSKLEFVSWSGGALAPKLGDYMVPLPTTSLKRIGDEADWPYVEFSDRTNVRWIPQGDGTYECQFLTTEEHPLAVENIPDVPGYATSDIFEPHPTKNYLWKIVGRVDDVIIHASGEKTVPAPMEGIIMSSPYLMGAIMFGRAHDQPGILLEAKPPYAIDTEDEDQVAKFRNFICRSCVQQGIQGNDSNHAQNKPLPRAGKGTVMRKLALQVYNEEIEALYATVESTQSTESIDPPSLWDKEHVSQWILDQGHDLNSGRKLIPSEDLLSATILRRRITAALQSIKGPSGAAALKSINQNTVYSHPTVEALSDFLVTLVADPNASHSPKSRQETIENLINKYMVLLTGTTGNLGAQLLESLLRDPRISQVYALNRSASSKSLTERHEERFRDKALDLSLLKSDKLTAIEGDLSQKNLGLSSSLYDEIRESVNIIIHTAWRLDFNLSVTSFESNIRGTRNLIELRIPVRMPQISIEGLYPEEVILDTKYAVGGGYGESKYVTERVLTTSELNATSIRVGQISGGNPNGAWATTDWIPILVKSSLALGALPTASGVVSWTPMDAVSDSILDLVFYPKRFPSALNLVHSKPIKWNAVIQYIADALARERGMTASIPLVSFQEWVSMLEKRARSSTNEDQANIVSFYLHISLLMRTHRPPTACYQIARLFQGNV